MWRTGGQPVSRPAKDLRGRRIGHWKVIKRVQPGPGVKSRKALWLCRCVCGTERVLRGCVLTHQQSRSCGCKRAKIRRQRARNAGRAGGKADSYLPTPKQINQAAAEIRARWSADEAAARDPAGEQRIWLPPLVSQPSCQGSWSR